MKERDNRDIQFTHLAMENVRLQNLVREYEEEFRLRDEEDAAEKAQMAELLASKDQQIAEQAVLIESQKKDIKRITADRDQEREGRIKAEEEKEALIIQLNQQEKDHEEEMKELLPAKEMLKEAEKHNVDSQAFIKKGILSLLRRLHALFEIFIGDFCCGKMWSIIALEWLSCLPSN